MANLNLESVIEDSISDSLLSDTPETTPEVVETALETPSLGLETTPETTPESTEASLDTLETPEVSSPAQRVLEANQAPKPQEDFEKKFGVQRESVPGRENRIPYSRVKKIVEKAETEARKAAEAPYTVKVQEYETKVKDYESRLANVAQFEHVMLNDVPRFIGMLKTLPQYQQFFSQYEAQAQPKAPEQVAQVNPEDEMPQPDQLMPDGSYMYSMDGLRKLQDWNRAQARKEVLLEVDKVYGPIREERERDLKLQAAIPRIQAQIVEARKWPLFIEHESEITKVLQQYPQASLSDAYHYVCDPHIQERITGVQTNEATLRQKVRAEVLAELKRAPAATSVPSRTVRPSPVTSGSGRSLEDVIAAQVASIK